MGRFGYTGQIWMGELGLFHYKARMYSPKLGRFLQTDPIFYADNMNMYAYVANDPVNKIDPTGTSCTMNDGKADCKVDDPGKMSKREIVHVEKVYTKAVNNLLKNPSRTREITVKDKKFTVTSGNLAKALVGAKVIGGAASDHARASTAGGEEGSIGGKRTTDSGGVEITIHKNAINRNAMSQGYEDRALGRTFIHEAVHTQSAESAMNELWGNTKESHKEFNEDHVNSYNSAADYFY